MARLEHVGIAVSDAAAAIELYETLLQVLPYKAEGVQREGVRTHFLATETAKVELLESLDDDGPVGKFLTRRGPGLHHLAFEVDDIEATMGRLRAAGFTPLADTPRRGADGKRIFFLHPKDTHGVLVEFCAATSRVPTAIVIPYRRGHLAVYVYGSSHNPPLVLLHDLLGTTATQMAGLAAQLEQDYHVLAIDFAGHGSSELPTLPGLSLPFLADHVRAVMDHFELASTHLLGYGVGGLTALYLACQHRAWVEHLVVHETEVGYASEGVPALQERLVAEAREAGATSETMERLTLFAGTLPIAAPSEAELRGLRVPVLVSAGDGSPLVASGQAQRLQAWLPAGQLAVLPGRPSAPPPTGPGAFSWLVHQHLAGASAPAWG